MKTRSQTLWLISALGIFLYSCTVIHVPGQQTQPTTVPIITPVMPATQPTTVPVLYSMDDVGLQQQFDLGGAVQPGTYRVSNTVNINRSGIYDLSHVIFKGIHGTLLSINADNVTLVFPTFDSIYPAVKPNGQNPKVGVAGLFFKGQNCLLDHADFLNIDQGIGIYPHTHFLMLLEPHFEPLLVRGANIYLGGGDETSERGQVFWLGGYGKSEQEHCIRGSTIGFTGLYCYGVNFFADTGKECVAPRQGKKFLFDHCTFNGLYAAFVGETTGDVSSCQDVTFQHCEIMGSYIDVRAAKGVNVLSNIFHPSIDPLQAGQETQIVKGAAGISKDVVIKGNQRYVPTLTPRNRGFRPILSAPFIDAGGNVNVVIKD